MYHCVIQISACYKTENAAWVGLLVVLILRTSVA